MKTEVTLLFTILFTTHTFFASTIPQPIPTPVPTIPAPMPTIAAPVPIPTITAPVPTIPGPTPTITAPMPISTPAMPTPIPPTETKTQPLSKESLGYALGTIAPNTTSLELQNKNITTFEGAHLLPSQLESLNLSNNQIKNLNNATWSKISIKTILLSQNPIELIDGTKLPASIKKLFLDHASLKTIKKITDLPITLEFLSLIGNEITDKDLNGIEKFPPLQELVLAENNITTLVSLAPLKVTKMVQLNLSGNKIKNLNGIQALYFYELKTLNLSNNGLTSIDDLIHATIPAITHIDFSKNQITTIPTPVLKKLAQNNRLESINFKMNPLSCQTKKEITRILGDRGTYDDPRVLATTECSTSTTPSPLPPPTK